MQFEKILNEKKISPPIFSAGLSLRVDHGVPFWAGSQQWVDVNGK
jgi:hypothetical protein